MAEQPILQRIENRLNEIENGYVIPYKTKDGGIANFNKLDYLAGLNLRRAIKEEENYRVSNHFNSIVTLSLVLVVIFLIILLNYLKSGSDITGIYYDENGNKVEVYHNKYLNQVKFIYIDGKGNEAVEVGMLKKINSQYYGLYLEENEVIGKYSLSAYADVRRNSIEWKNSIWYK